MFASSFTLYQKARIKWVKLKRMLSIPKGQKVIDIGGGDGTFSRADVVCEKFIGDDSERVNPFYVDRPLVVGDIENLPFLDNTFDFVYCSHILEHVNNPDLAINEITRIGSRGFLEVPSEYLELSALSMKAHLWTIKQDEDGSLIFKQKKTAVPNPHVDEVFRTHIWEKEHYYMSFYWKNYYKLFNIGLYWEKIIPHKVKHLKNDERQSNFEKGEIESLSRITEVLKQAQSSPQKVFDPRYWIKKSIKSILTDNNTLEWLMGSLACPICKNMLHKESPDILHCSNCKSKFPVIRGVPLLLKEYVIPPSDNSVKEMDLTSK